MPLTEEIVRPLLDVLDSFPEPVAISPNDLHSQGKKPATMFKVKSEVLPTERILGFLRGVPKDPRFWGALCTAARDKEEVPEICIDKAAADYIRGTEQTSERPAPPQWQNHAAKVLLVIEMLQAGALLATRSGRPKELTGEEKEATTADCEKWYPVCQKLKEAFKPLWDKPAYWNLRWEDRQEVWDKLAKACSISVGEVRGMEPLLRDRTPWDTTILLVARSRGHEFGTVERIWLDFRRRKRERTYHPS